MQSVTVWALTLAALAATEPPAGDVMRVHLEASAPGTGAAGRVAAVQKAQEEAVLQVVKTLTATDDLLMFRPLLDRAPAYMRSYEVLDQKQVGDATEVKLEAYILYKQLKRDLAALVLPLFPKPPKVVVVVDAGEGVEVDPSVEDNLAEAFRDAGVEVVDPSKVRAGLPDAELRARLHGDAEAAVRFAWENLADVAVVGEVKAVTEEPRAGSNVRANRATVLLRIIRGEDARTFDVQTAEALVHSRKAAEGRAMAVSDACDKIKDPALVSVVLAVAGAKGTPYVVVTVEGLGSEEQWQALCAWAKQCPDVEEAEPLHFSGTTGRLRLKYDGPMAPLVDALTEQEYPGFYLAPRQVIERDVVLAVAE